MAREIPEAVRAAAGLAATVLDETRRLPETLPALPVRVLGMAMQLSMKLQQHYAGLVARGDELFTGLLGEDEPGLATFDDDEPAGPVATAAKVGTSAFDRVAETVIEVTEDDESAAAEEALDELAIEELVDQSPAPGGAEALADALLEGEDGTAPDVDSLVDVPTADGGVETVEATVTDEGIAAPEAAPEAGAGDTATDEPEGDSEPAGSQAAGIAPIVGYDDWSIAQLRGRLRGYATSTVQELFDYEQATRAREPYLRMLRNRLDRLHALQS
jgi:hypothetical protein